MSYKIYPTESATGPGWQYRLERDGVFSTWRNWAADFGFTLDPDGGDLRLNVLYWLYARNAAVTAYEPGSLERELAASLFIRDGGRIEAASPDGDVPTPGLVLDTIPKKDAFLRDLLGAMSPTTKDVLSESAGAKPAVTPELLLSLVTAASTVTATHIQSDLPTIGEMLIRAYGPNAFRLICNGLASVGCSGGSGTGSGGVTLSTADMLALAEFDYQWAAWKEGRLDPGTGQPIAFPSYPTLSGGTPTTPSQNAVINANLSVYRDTEGLIIQANCSNGEEFYGRVLGQNGANPPSTAWARLSRIDGTMANGTYVENFGFLQAGTYATQVRIGVDNSTIVEKIISVTSSEPIGKGIYKITGNLTPPENVVNEQYTLLEQYTDDSWRAFTGAQTWVLVSVANGTPVPAGIGIGGDGKMSGGADIISVDTPIIIRCYIGINVELPITLKNTVDGTVPPPVTQVINGVFKDDIANVGRVGYANTTAPAEAITVIYKVVNGVETIYNSPSTWTPGTLIDGAYNSGGATVQVVWGYNSPNVEGTYRFYEVWRPIATGDTDTSLYKRLPGYTVVVGAQNVTTPWEIDPDFALPAQDTVKYVQYRFVPSGHTGGGDLLEVQMVDGYDEQPMFIYFRLASQAGPPAPSTFNSYKLFSRVQQGDKLSQRNFQPVSGQNLKSKSFKIDISTNANTAANVLSLSIVTTNLATEGWVNIYSGT